MIYTHTQSSRAFWVTLALSLALHGAVLWLWLPKFKFTAPPLVEDVRPDSLVVQLAPPPAPAPPAPAAAPPPPPPPRAVAPPPARAVAPPPPRPAASPRAPAPAAPPVATAPAAPPAAPSRPPPGVADLAAYVEAQRRARAQAAAPAAQSPPVEDENARLKRIVAGNLAAPRITFDFDANRTGGTFVMRFVADSYAEFSFYGWKKDIQRNIRQDFEVRKGNNSDIYIAIVRRIIAIVREQVEAEEFSWFSRRLDRSVTLSALPKDNALLEDFIMQEVLFDMRRVSR
jgi:outer membrane biosynthesis protein TonB